MTEFGPDIPLSEFERHGGNAMRVGPASVHVDFGSGWTVSIIWGYGSYSANRWAARGLEGPSPDAEVACWQTGEEGYATWSDGQPVQGWRSWDDVQALLANVAAGDVREPLDWKDIVDGNHNT